MSFYSFQTAARIYKDIENSYSGRIISKESFAGKSNFLFVKKIWDSYKMPQGMKKSETLIGVLKEKYSNIYACRACRPLGDFKDYATMNHEEIYNTLINLFQVNQKTADGGIDNYADLLYPYAKFLSARFNYKNNDKYFNKKAFEQGLSLMIYRSTIGIYLESYIHTLMIKNFDRSNEFVYRIAPSEWESDDVDGIICRRDTDDIVVRISIKTLKAFTEDCIFGEWRKPELEGGKGKTLPDIYMGISDEKDIKVETILVDKSLKQLLLDSRKNLVNV